jgi:hypothetical protein
MKGGKVFLSELSLTSQAERLCWELVKTHNHLSNNNDNKQNFHSNDRNQNKCLCYFKDCTLRTLIFQRLLERTTGIPVT